MSARLERSSGKRSLSFFLAVALVTSCGTRAPERPPNFVVICVDTLRVDHLGHDGYARATSPRIDELAAQGARFRACFSTYPQTAASIASLFTSLPPSAHKKTTKAGTTLTSSVPLLAQTLRAAGYRTGAVATNPHLSPGLGYEQGFERYTYVSGKKSYSLFEASRTYAGTVVDVRSSEADAYGRGDAVNRAALEWFDAAPDARPFFLYLHYMDVHSPYDSPEPYHRMFVEQEGRYRYCNGIPRWPVKPADVHYSRALYDGQIRYLDELLGEVIDALDERGLLERTYLVLLADHGEEFLEHGGLGHGETLYREMLHVPLLVVGPRVRARVEESIVSTLDLYPTLCELAGIAAPPHVQGTSLVPLLEGAPSPARAAFAECVDARVRAPKAPAKTRKVPGHALALVDGEWHLIHRPDDGHTELYRYRADPRETADQSAAQPQEVERLLVQAQRLWQAAMETGRSIQAEEVELDPAALQQLEDLGYAGEESEESEDGR